MYRCKINYQNLEATKLCLLDQIIFPHKVDSIDTNSNFNTKFISILGGKCFTLIHPQVAAYILGSRRETLQLDFLKIQNMFIDL